MTEQCPIYNRRKNSKGEKMNEEKQPNFPDKYHLSRKELCIY